MDEHKFDTQPMYNVTYSLRLFAVGQITANGDEVKSNLSIFVVRGDWFGADFFPTALYL